MNYNNINPFFPPFQGGVPLTYHSYYSVLLPIALRVEDYGYNISFNGEDMYITECPSGVNVLRLIITIDHCVAEPAENIKAHHIQCYINNRPSFHWVDFISGNNLTRVIGDITVRVENGIVLWNKVYPLP
jgi:hypothetical protein